MIRTIPFLLLPVLVWLVPGQITCSAGVDEQEAAKLEKQRKDAKGPTPLLDKELKDANLQLARMNQYSEILVHRGMRPSDYEGCIGAGWIEDKKTLSYADEAMEYIYGLIGGGKIATAPEVTFKVVGVMPDIKTITEYA